MGNDKDFKVTRGYSVEGKYGNVLVRMRYAATRGLCKFLRKPGCPFDAWLTGVVQVGIEREHNH